MKICARCGLEKSNGDFAKDAKSTDGLQSWCKECQREWHDDNLGSIEYRCIICDKGLNNHNWLCSECYDEWVEDTLPVSEWPNWIHELIKLEGRRRYIRRLEANRLVYLEDQH